MNKLLLIIITIIIMAGLGAWWLNFVYKNNKVEEVVKVNNFQECVKDGNPVMESYPRQCRAGKKTFTEYIGNENEKADLIFLDYPRPNQAIKSPLVIKGQARGFWFFEGDFPVVLTNWDGLIIGDGIAQAQGEWMTEEFVPFVAVIEFEVPEYKNNGTLILQKDNPSDLPENDDALEIPVLFEKNGEIVLPLNSD
ncbi:MAG: Gmad2 immunoglobulin-like domain-containing protein [Patescibacteria group bacterium]|nr:Gmad2 immunoglobulin-like domain-containing protein [Patescibacteria group bacterium]